MISNLFSNFDPSTNLGARWNWTILLLRILLFPSKKWRVDSRWLRLQISLISALLKEIKLLLNKGALRRGLIFLALFYIIVWCNTIGLIPYIFTPTRHLRVTLRLAFPLWLGYFRYGWFSNIKSILAHLVPQETPGRLIPFIVIIERLRRLIRPGTLAVRLTANIIAGHLLLTLIRGAVSIFSVGVGLRVIFLQVLLVLLEVAVAFVQAYVLVILRVLYTREV
jgi:F-type H+-transporting ATPase subunit a